MTMIAFEKHYRVPELAKLWGFSRDTIIRYFANEPGVLRLAMKSRTTLSIPESVALRVHERLSKQVTILKVPKPILRVLKLSEFRARVQRKHKPVAGNNPTDGLA